MRNTIIFKEIPRTSVGATLVASTRRAFLKPLHLENGYGRWQPIQI